MRNRLMALALLFGATPAHAEVVAASDTSLTVRTTVTVTASIATAWSTLEAPAVWWPSDYTYSRRPGELSLSPRAGGCLCERLINNGSAEIMHVLLRQPGQRLRLSGMPRPLDQKLGYGLLDVTFQERIADRKKLIDVTFEFRAFGQSGMGQMAGHVDMLFAEAALHYQNYANTRR